MKKNLSLIVLMIIMVIFTSSYVLAGSPGSKGAVFLKLGQGARANAMGESFCAVSDDINALYWNPAGISQIKERQCSFMYSDWLQEIKYNYLAYAHPTQIMSGIIGGAITLLDSGSIEKHIDNDGKADGTFNGKNIALGISYGRQILENCSLGATLKYIQMKIDNKKSTGFGLDIGCLYKPQIENLTLGVVIQNLGPKLSAFNQEKDALPLNFKFGGAYQLLNKALTLSLDINFPSDNDTNFNFGAEYWFKEIVAIRAGYKSLTKDDLKSSDITFGAGFKIPMTGIELDYAYCDYDDLGDTHRISLMAKFQQ